MLLVLKVRQVLIEQMESPKVKVYEGELLQSFPPAAGRLRL